MKDESTSDLRNILNTTTLNEIDSYLKNHTHKPTAYDIYNRHIKEHPISVATIYKNCKSFITKSYVYDIINGIKTHPSRDVVIIICLAAHMTLKQVRQLLEIYNHRELYPKDDRDALIAACFNSKEYNIVTINELLYIRNLPLLSGSKKNPDADL